MVKVRWASLVVVDDATLVLEPLRVAGTDTNRDGTHEVQGTLQLSRILMSHIPVMVDSNYVFTIIIIAVSRATSVRVVLLRFKSIIPYVIVDPVGEATTAALILVGI